MKVKITPAADGAPVVTAELSARDLLTYRDKILDTAPVMGIMLAAAERTLVSTDAGTFVKDLECPKCTGLWQTQEERPALKFVGGNYGPGYQDQNERLACQLCGGRTVASQLGAVLWPDGGGRKGGRSKFYDRFLPITKLRPRGFTVVRYKKELLAVGGDFTVLAQSVTPKRFDPATDIDALWIWAVHRDVADAAAAEEGLPWAVVPCTPQCQPLAEWHGQPLSATEQAVLWSVQNDQRQRRDATIDTKLRAERQRLIEETPLA